MSHGPSDSASIPIESLLANTAWLKRLAVSLLGDEHAAEDLVQDTMLAAMTHDGPVDKPRAWLGGVLRHLGLRRHRRAATRGRTEQEAARADHEQSTATTVEKATLQRDVVDSVLALEEPYRSVILRRYFDSIKPGAIAKELSLPVETVRTQIKRGLSQLRGRLDKRYGDRTTWTTPMAAWATVGASAGSTWTASRLVLRLGYVVFATGLVVGGYMVFFEMSTVPSSTELTAAEVPGTTASAVNAGLDAGAPGDERRKVLAPVEGPGDFLVMRGRCVAEESGRPLAGCEVIARHYTQNARMQPIRTTSAADGRFALRLDRRGVWQIELHCTLAGRVEVSGIWLNVKGAQVFDIGDAFLPLGATWRGQLRDEQGLPVAPVRISALRIGPELVPKGAFRPKGESRLSVAANGSFASNEPLLPGIWKIDTLERHKLLRPQHLAVKRAGQIVEEDIVVRREESLPKISGFVIGADGRPAKGFVYAVGNDTKNEAGIAADGRFVVRQIDGEDVAEQVRLVVPGDTKHKRLISSQKFPWNHEGITLRLEARGAAKTMMIEVVDAETGTPIEGYRLFAEGRLIRETGRSSLGVRQVGGHLHPRGVVELTDCHAESNDLERGKPEELVVVVPNDSKHGVSIPRRIAYANHARVRIELARQIAMTVVVKDREGTPVADTAVQLLSLREGLPDWMRDQVSFADVRKMLAMRKGQWVQSAERGLILGESRTDGAGKTIVHGPRGAKLAIRVFGPQHQTKFETGVLVDPKTTIEVVVERGATIRGHVKPRDLVKRLASLIRAGTTEQQMELVDRPEETAPRVFLAFKRTPTTIKSYRTNGIELREDGTFVCSGVPPGRWQIALRTSVPTYHGGSGQIEYRYFDVVELKSGETREVELDATHILPGRVRGQVFLGDEPYVRGRFSFHERSAWDDSMLRNKTLHRTDDHGRFDVPVTGKELRLVLHLPASAQPEQTPFQRKKAEVDLEAIEEIVIEDSPTGHSQFLPSKLLLDDVWFVRDASQPTQRMFRLRKITVVVRVLDHAGKPVVGRRIQVREGGVNLSFGEEVVTDAKGEIRLDPLPLTPVTLHTFKAGMHPRLGDKMSLEARALWMAASREAGNDRSRFETYVMHRLGPLQVPGGKSGFTVEWRLPKEN